MSERYKKEIEEILKQAEEVMPKKRSRPSSRRSRLFGRLFNPLSRLSSVGRGLNISAGKLMLSSIALLLVALVLYATGIGSVVYFFVAGMVLFVIAYALFFIRPDGSYEKRWRGRRIEDKPPLWARVKRWFKG